MPKTAPNVFENSLPIFWPALSALQAGATMAGTAESNLRFMAETLAIDHPPPPKWHSRNRIRLELATMRLREFGSPGAGVPILIDAPFAGHSSTIADFAAGQSLVGALMAAGAPAVWVTDWKSATPEMRFFSIDTYLAELNAAIDDLGGRVHLVGLCQGGWLSAMLAARFPQKVASLVLAGSPIDTNAGHGPIRQMAHEMPYAEYAAMVAGGGGLMPGLLMLTGWKNMHAKAQYHDKYAELYRHLGDRNYLTRTKRFESWYENPLDLPGSYYLQAIQQLFKDNLFAKGRFIGLGRRLSLKDVTCPTYLLAGASDDITTKEQVFAARRLLGTPQDQIAQALVPGGHIGLFMGHKTIAETWPVIGRWILSHG